VLLGLDLGTSSAKALLLDEDGYAVGEGSASYPVRSSHPGWAETSPGHWWRAVVEATKNAVGARGAQVAALGLSGQMHGVVLTDDRGSPLRSAILWADARSTEQLAAYRRLDEGARRRLANPPAVGMAGPSLLWLRDHEPDVYTSARWALQPKDWLRLRLTGEVFAEPSDASATLLYDLRSDSWDHPVVETLGLRPDLLAPLVASANAAGTLRKEAAEHLGLRAGLPVAAGAADTAAAQLGGGLLRPGPVQLTVGTGAQIVAPKSSPEPDPHGRTHLYRAAVPDLWYAMSAIQNAGLALEWARGVLGVSWEEVYEEASRRGGRRLPAVPQRRADAALRPRCPRCLDRTRSRPRPRASVACSPGRRRVRASRGPRGAGGGGDPGSGAEARRRRHGQRALAADARGRAGPSAAAASRRGGFLGIRPRRGAPCRAGLRRLPDRGGCSRAGSRSGSTSRR
jgi:sugar (pentulose or hexulose) kinase